MKKIEFETLLRAAIEKMVAEQGRKSGALHIDYELKGAGVSAETLTLDQLIDRLYVDETTYMPVIDCGIRVADSDYVLLSFMVSGRKPVAWEKTWGGISGSEFGPFKFVTFAALSRRGETERKQRAEEYKKQFGEEDRS